MSECVQWTLGYAASACEWLSCSCLWLLITMGLNAAVRLNDNDGDRSPVTDKRARLVANHHRKHHHHQQQQQQQGEKRPTRCRQLSIGAAIQLICVVSCLPQFFAHRLVGSVDEKTNRTVIVSRLDEQLTKSFEYSVVYHWYFVCLTVVLPVPLLVCLVVVFASSLARRWRTRRRKVPVKLTNGIQSPSVLLFFSALSLLMVMSGDRSTWPYRRKSPVSCRP